VSRDADLSGDPDSPRFQRSPGSRGKGWIPGGGSTSRRLEAPVRWGKVGLANRLEEGIHFNCGTSYPAALKLIV